MAIHDRCLYRPCYQVRLDLFIKVFNTHNSNSVKMIGLFVTALVGLYTVEDLWDKFGDLKMSWVSLLSRHLPHSFIELFFSARPSQTLGSENLLPYCRPDSCLHGILQNPLPDLEPFWSGRCSNELSVPSESRGQRLCQEPAWSVLRRLSAVLSHSPSTTEIAYGSKLTLKNMGWGGGLLHSHVQTYPVGSGQQQVTCYHYKDDNNHWVVLPRWDQPNYNPNDELKYLAHGDVIRLSHTATNRNLHSHTVVAPVSKLNHEVSGYGNATLGDSGDYWQVEVVDDLTQGKKVDRIHSLTTRLRFRHQQLGCYLRAANSILPQWGFKQVEVSCDKENKPDDAHTYWNVESHWNDRRACFRSHFSLDVFNIFCLGRYSSPG